MKDIQSLNVEKKSNNLLMDYSFQEMKTRIQQVTNFYIINVLIENVHTNLQHFNE